MIVVLLGGRQWRIASIFVGEGEGAKVGGRGGEGAGGGGGGAQCDKLDHRRLFCFHKIDSDPIAFV